MKKRPFHKKAKRFWPVSPARRWDRVVSGIFMPAMMLFFCVIVAGACLHCVPKVKTNRISASDEAESVLKQHYKASVLKTVFMKLPRLRGIYHRRLREVPGLFGELVVRFAVDASGSVVHSRVVFSSMQDSAFDNQIKNELSSWAFGSAEGFKDSVEVAYPFIFFEADTIPSALLRQRKIEVSKNGPRESPMLRERIDTLTNYLYFECCRMKNDSIRGSLEVELSIASRGTVDRVAVIESTIGDKTFFEKALRTIESFDFQKDSHAGTTKLRWRFYFDKKNLICP